MLSDLDMNSQEITNASAIRTGSLYVNGQLITANSVDVAGKQVYSATATAGQTLFTGVNTYTQGIVALDVYINGVYQDNTQYAETSTTSITFTTGLNAGDYVVVISASDQTVNVAQASDVPYTPTAGDTSPTNVSAFLGSIIQGSGDPEGSITASVGALFLRSDGGANTTLYVKETGTGNTGWAAK
jgi:hypothetical protein